MELHEFLQPFKKNLGLSLLTMVIFGTTAYIVSLRLPVKYQATLTLYMHQAAALTEGSTGEPKDYYTYDGYYAHKAAQEYTDTVLGFLESPDILRRAGESIWTQTDETQQEKLQKAVTAEKIAPQLVKLTVTYDNANDASRLTEGLTQAIQEKSNSLSESGSKVKIDALSLEPLIKTLEPHGLLNTFIAASAGLLFSFVAVWIKEYLGVCSGRA